MRLMWVQHCWWPRLISVKCIRNFFLPIEDDGALLIFTLLLFVDRLSGAIYWPVAQWNHVTCPILHLIGCQTGHGEMSLLSRRYLSLQISQKISQITWLASRKCLTALSPTGSLELNTFHCFVLKSETTCVHKPIVNCGGKLVWYISVISIVLYSVHHETVTYE